MLPPASHLVDVLLVLLGPATRVRAERRRLHVGQNRVGREDDAPIGLAESKAEVDVVVGDGKRLVEPADLVERLLPHKHAGARDSREVLVQPEAPRIRWVAERRAEVEMPCDPGLFVGIPEQDACVLNGLVRIEE